MKNFILVSVIVVLGVGFLFYIGNRGASIEPPFEVGVLHPLDHIKGVASSTVVVMEYSDFQCPACRSYYPVMRQVMTEFGDRITFVYRNFPLIGIHQNAEFAARAAEAASKQDKFWEMHDLLFEKQDEWAKAVNVSPVFESYATLLGLDLEQFRADWQSSEVKNLVKAERTHALKIGLQGTPTFFINGKQIQNPSSLEAFRLIIKSAFGE